MSKILEADVIENAPYQGSHYLVLCMCADVANDNGIFWHSIPKLAKRCRLSRRRFLEVIADLEVDGAIQRQARFKGRKQRSNIWMLIPYWRAGAVADIPDDLPDEDELQPRRTGAEHRTPTGAEHRTPTGAEHRTPTGAEHRTQNRQLEPSIEPSDGTDAREGDEYIPFASKWIQLTSGIGASEAQLHNLRNGVELVRHETDAADYVLMCANTAKYEYLQRFATSLEHRLRSMRGERPDAHLRLKLRLTQKGATA